MTFLLFVPHSYLAPSKILEVARGIEYIHSVGAVHGDLRGVFYLNSEKCDGEMLNISFRRIFS